MPAQARVVAVVADFVVIAADVAVADTAVERSRKKTFFRAGTGQRLSSLEIWTSCGLMRWFVSV